MIENLKSPLVKGTRTGLRIGVDPRTRHPRIKRSLRIFFPQ
jgi:hypothetical protein